MAPDETCTVSAQIAEALGFLNSQARSTLEASVFMVAKLLCQGLAEQHSEKPAAGNTGLQIDPWRPLPALQFLENEAKRCDLQDIEAVVDATISLWMIAEDIEMLKGRRPPSGRA